MKNFDKVTIFDTTLRDGTQGTGINLTLKDKLDIAAKLDEAGVDYIEGGFPLSSEKEASFFRLAQKENYKHSKITAFGSTRKSGNKAESDPYITAMLQAETPAVVVVGKSWKEHVEKVINTTFEENLEMIYDSIHLLKKEGREVIFDLEHFFDGYKGDSEYALKVLQTGTEAGAHSLVLCDTNGGTLPMEVLEIINSLPQKDLAPIGVHFHNDTGNAVANSIMSVTAGASHIQGTINGWGERCGNANLCIIVPNLALKMGIYTNMNDGLSGLTTLSRYVAEKANVIPDKSQPYVGETAFSHKAGQHADVIAKAPELMEHIDGKLVGNKRKILISGLAGKSTIVRKLAKYGDFDKQSEVVSSLFESLKEKELEGYEYEAAEASFDLIIRKSLDRFASIFDLSNYHLESFKTKGAKSKTVGRIFLKVKGIDHMGAAVGEGPVETLDEAIRDALIQTHPFLSKMHLIDYKVRILNPEEAAHAKTRVFITSSDHQHSWDTVGVSENIVEASWEALIDSMNYYYNNFVLEEDN
ncbi:MAG: citramalate synthase [Spirochaetaceae bacterium]|nr:citramalate synthase [Spirochaetaceae bacterium]